LEGLTRAGVQPEPIDLPGHGTRAGRTDASEFTLEAALAIVDGASRSDEGDEGSVSDTPRRVGEPFGVVGYSMGGRLALHHALAHPERVERLVLESASPGIEGEEARARRRASDEALADRIVDQGIEAFVEYWASLPLFASQRRLDDGVRAAHRARRLANAPESLAAALRGLGTGALPSLWSSLADLRTPTLLIAGSLDPKFVGIAERMAERLPNARVAIVPDAGHTVHLERPDRWLHLVADFFDEN